MATAIKAKPGTYRGVEYRSQLEISWAKWFWKNKVDAEYVDEHWHDFLINGWEWEIKPPCAELIEDAITRGLEETDHFRLLVGSPPNAYGKPFMMQVFDQGYEGVILICTARISGPSTKEGKSFDTQDLLWGFSELDKLNGVSPYYMKRYS